MPKANTEADAPTVAYIIVAWNNLDILDDCIISAQEQDYPSKRIVLIDNASADGTVAHVQKRFPDVEVLAQTANHGFAKGNNIGIKKVLEDANVAYVVLLNSDARFARNWTSVLVDAAKLRPKTATMQSITLDYYDHEIVDSTHIYLSNIGQATQGSFRRPMALGFEAPPEKVFGCNAAAMLITRSFIDAQPFEDLFDETLFMYLEDVDVAMRATVMGWDNFVVPGTRAYHMGSASSGKNPGFSLYMTFRNNLSIHIKNLPLPVLVKVLAFIPRSDRASIRHMRRIGKPEGVKYIIKGRLASLRFIPIFMYKRWRLKKYRIIDATYLWHLMRHGF